MFFKKEINKVGRPKLADKKLINESKLMLLFSFIIIGIFVASGIDTFTSSNNLNMLSKNKLSASLSAQQKNNFVIKNNNNVLTIIPPANAKYYSVRVFDVGSLGLYKYDSVYNKISSVDPTFTFDMNSKDDTKYKILVRWAVTYAGATYKPLSASSWKASDYVVEKHLGITWTAKEYEIKGSGAEGTTKSNFVENITEVIECPTFTEEVKGSVATITVDPKNDYNWDWYTSTSYKLDAFYDFKRISINNNGKKTFNVQLNPSVYNKARVVVKAPSGKIKICSTGNITVEGGIVRTTKPGTTRPRVTLPTRTTRPNTTRTTGSSLKRTKVTLNASGMSFYKIGTKIGPVVVRTNPATSVKWSTSNASAVKIIPDNSDPNRITIQVVGAGVSIISARAEGGGSASFIVSSIYSGGGTNITTKPRITRTTKPRVTRTTKPNITRTTKPNSSDGFWSLFSSVKCPTFKYSSSPTNVTIGVTPRDKGDKWTWYENSDNNTGSRGKWLLKGTSITGAKNISLGISNYRKQAKIVVTSDKGKTRTCYTKSYSKPTNKPVTNKPVTNKPAANNKVSINVQGTNTYNIGQGVGNIVASVSPANSTVKWTSSNPKVVAIQVTKTNTIGISIIGLGQSTITATSNSGAKASFIVVGKESQSPNSIAKSGINQSLSGKINGIDVYVENGCNSGVINNYKNLLKKFPDHLNKFRNVYFLKGSSIKSTCSGAEGCCYPAYRSSLRVSCDNYGPQILVHEAAHSMDFYYRHKFNEGLISEKAEVVKVWQKYKNIFNNGKGKAYLRYYAYGARKGSGYTLHKNALEFYAEAYTVYFKHRIDSSVPYRWGYDTKIPSDIENAIKPYINKLQGS